MLGFDNRDTLWTMGQVAAIHTTLGHHAEARKLHEDSLALRKASLGPRHRDTLTSMHDLGVSYLASGGPARAKEPSQETLALRKAELGLDDSQTLRTMVELVEWPGSIGQPHRRPQDPRIGAGRGETEPAWATIPTTRCWTRWNWSTA